jgi:tetrahydromethanopterin S-methyltransferase subunit G
MSPNVAIISATIAVVTLVFAIFGASWLNQRHIEKLLEQLEKRVDERFTTLEQRFEQRFVSLEKRFDQRFASVEQRLDRIERQLEALFKPVLPPRP